MPCETGRYCMLNRNLNAACLLFFSGACFVMVLQNTMDCGRHSMIRGARSSIRVVAMFSHLYCGLTV